VFDFYQARPAHEVLERAQRAGALTRGSGYPRLGESLASVSCTYAILLVVFGSQAATPRIGAVALVVGTLLVPVVRWCWHFSRDTRMRMRRDFEESNAEARKLYTVAGGGFDGGKADSDH